MLGGHFVFHFVMGGIARYAHARVQTWKRLDVRSSGLVEVNILYLQYHISRLTVIFKTFQSSKIKGFIPKSFTKWVSRNKDKKINDKLKKINVTKG